MKKKIFSALLVLFLCFTCLSCTKADNTTQDVIENETSNKLQILDSDLKLTQDQVMTQVKAEYLIENNGYKDTDDTLFAKALL